MIEKRDELYAGKAKSVYKTDDERYLILNFRDDISAFNSEKTATLSRKGLVNNQFNAFIMEKLEAGGVPTHHERLLSANESLVKHLDMLPVECVVRNIAAGSICRRLGLEEGMTLDMPLFEFFYKDDDLGDPMINDHHILAFGWGTQADIDKMKALTLQVNEILTPLFAKHGMLLVDYKLEFGRSGGKLYLGDEFTPDGCRLWDSETREKLDKDRFRSDLGDVVETYQAVARRMGLSIKETL